MSDGRRGRSRHADMVDGDVMGSKGMGGKDVMVMVVMMFFALTSKCVSAESSHGTFDREDRASC